MRPGTELESGAARPFQGSAVEYAWSTSEHLRIERMARAGWSGNQEPNRWHTLSISVKSSGLQAT